MGGADDMRELDAGSAFNFACTPEDIAAHLLHFCSEDGNDITINV